MKKKKTFSVLLRKFILPVLNSLKPILPRPVLLLGVLTKYIDRTILHFN